MSEPSQTRAPQAQPLYRRETWLVVALLAFIPVILASVAPTSWKTPLVAVSGVLVIAALAMTLRRDRALRADEDGRRPMNDGDMSSAT